MKESKEKEVKERVMKDISKRRQKKAIYRNGKEYSEADIFLAVLWLKGDIGFSDIKLSVGKKNNSNTYTFLALALKDGIRKHLIEVKEI